MKLMSTGPKKGGSGEQEFGEHNILTTLFEKKKHDAYAKREKNDRQ